MKKVRIVEVGLRDGLQNEKVILDIKSRLKLANQLLDAGVKHLELGAFVSKDWVPQMADSYELIRKQKLNKRRAEYSALVPNEKGMEKAVELGLKEIAIFASASESFSKKNINCSIKESLERYNKVIQIAKKNKMKVRAYLSTAFGCPYEGKISLNQVKKLSLKLLDMGAYEVSLGDTIGVANPLQTDKTLHFLLKEIPKKKIAMHFHDTRGMALANISKSLEHGIRIFDASVGGLGGCPYAKGASGNVATEDVVHMLHSMGYDTGLKLKKLVNISKDLEALMGRKMNSKLSQISS